jgi:tRNA (mo5U34)-methyltransferase
MSDTEEQVLAQEWFYPFTLPSGRKVGMYIPDWIAAIHTTRLEMMRSALAPILNADPGALTAIDLSSHQGYFSLALARDCRRVLGLEIQERHVESARLMARVLGIANVEFRHENLETMPPCHYEPADVVINFGLMYNLQNPIGVLRRSRELTRRVLLIESQTTMLDLSGAVDSGCYQSMKEMHGMFGVGLGNPGNSEGSASDIVLVPSRTALLWILQQLGFARIELIAAPPGGYDQLVTGKRIMIAAYV